MTLPTKKTLTKGKISTSENFVRTLRDETDQELALRQSMNDDYIDNYIANKVNILEEAVDYKHFTLNWTQIADSEKPLTDESTAEFKKYREDIKKIKETLVDSDGKPLDTNDIFWDEIFTDMFQLFPTEPTPVYKSEE
tara:strand:- start:214 stop:627 length:414 start_codon:yes stop_codon:yes gene_type:complete